MSLYYLSFFGLIVVLLCLFAWSQRKPPSRTDKLKLTSYFTDDSRPHVNFMPQIRQALAAGDIAFLSQKAGSKLAKRVESERKTIALSYLSALQGDFEELLGQAKLIAVLSPEVVALHEFERLRLSLEFSMLCNLVRARILLGFTSISQLSSLSDVASGLTVRIESAMRELAERAALATEIASPLDGRGIDSV